MRKLLLVLCYCITLCATAQSSKEKNDSVTALIKQYFNARNVDSLYALTGAGFQESLSKQQFAAISQTNLFPLGSMDVQFESYRSGTSYYKATFSNTVQSLYVSLDSANKLNTFLIRSYVSQKPKAVKPPTNNRMLTLLDKAVDSAVQSYLMLSATHGVSIGILQKDSFFFYGYGETFAGSRQIPNQNTLFEIGSITKTFTALLLADAVNSGKLKLDDPVNKYLPDSVALLQWRGTPVTIQMLSNHTSGISRMPANFDSVVTDPTDPYKAYDNRQLFHFYKTYQLERQPGTKYEYSNLAVGTLGVILERVYNKSYEQLLIEKICNPLQLNDTRQLIRKSDSGRVAKGYGEEGAYNGPWNFKSFSGAGSIRSSAADMLLYAKANMNEAPQSLQKAIQLTQAVTYNNGKTKVGLGWHYIRPGSDELLWHNGGTGGYNSYLGIDKTKKFAVIVLSNTAVNIGEVGNKLVKYMEK